jgi:hypothetical protein
MSPVIAAIAITGISLAIPLIRFGRAHNFPGFSKEVM